MGSNMKKKKCDDIEDAKVKEYSELSYKLFQFQDYKVRASNGKYKCPFCLSKDVDSAYTHLLQHAIRVSEGSLSGKQRAKHSAMARYLAVDLANEREKEARELERDINEKNDLITKERSCNEELKMVCRKLLKGMSETPCDLPVGIKKSGELEPYGFIDVMTSRMSPDCRNILSKGMELCSLWQEKIKDPHWYPFHIIEDGDKGKPQWCIVQKFIKEDDITLQALKEEWGEDIYNVVVVALIEVHERSPSGYYMVPEVWNYKEKRTATFDEVLHYFLAKQRTESDEMN